MKKILVLSFLAIGLLLAVAVPVVADDDICLGGEDGLPPFGAPNAMCQFEMSDLAPRGPFGPAGGN